MKPFFNLLSNIASILGISMLIGYVILIVYKIREAIKNG